jgi:hypothetical protein
VSDIGQNPARSLVNICGARKGDLNELVFRADGTRVSFDPAREARAPVEALAAPIRVGLALGRNSLSRDTKLCVLVALSAWFHRTRSLRQLTLLKSWNSASC